MQEHHLDNRDIDECASAAADAAERAERNAFYQCYCDAQIKAAGLSEQLAEEHAARVQAVAELTNACRLVRLWAVLERDIASRPGQSRPAAVGVAVAELAAAEDFAQAAQARAKLAAALKSCGIA